MTLTIAVLGTNSNAGKSIVTGALCRYYNDNGISVAPFKPVLVVEHEVQSGAYSTDSRFAFCVNAARTVYRPEMNPLQLIADRRDFFGRVLSPALLRLSSTEQVSVPLLSSDTIAYGELNKSLLLRIRKSVRQSFETLSAEHDLVIVEGAGSPIDVGDDDLSNLLIPRRYETRTVLVGKLSAGGAGAGLLGTLELLPADIRRTVAGFILNDLIGGDNAAISTADAVEARTGVRCLGILPNSWLANRWSDQEDELQVLAKLVEQRIDARRLLGEEAGTERS